MEDLRGVFTCEQMCTISVPGLGHPYGTSCQEIKPVWGGERGGGGGGDDITYLEYECLIAACISSLYLLPTMQQT